MQLTFLGATGTVTGSKYLVTAGVRRVLVDCGLFQGLKQLRLRNWEPLPVAPGSVDAVVLTHAHIDHSGYLPLFVRNGFRGKVYCSSATGDLCGILLPDSGRLQEEEAVIVPTFAVGRAQQLLYYLYTLKTTRRIADVPVYLNSPMAVDATRIFLEHQDEHRLSPEQCKTMFSSVSIVNTPDESKHLNSREGPMIILAGSGMATGGRVVHHLKAFAPDPRNTILFAGFQVVGTRGATILNGVDSVKIHG